MENTEQPVKPVPVKPSPQEGLLASTPPSSSGSNRSRGASLTSASIQSEPSATAFTSPISAAQPQPTATSATPPPSSTTTTPGSHPAATATATATATPPPQPHQPPVATASSGSWWHSVCCCFGRRGNRSSQSRDTESAPLLGP